MLCGWVIGAACHSFCSAGLNMSPSPTLPKLQLRTNVSNAGLPSDFREVLQRRLGELERQLLRKVAELEDEKSLLHNETSAHRQKTESTLNALLQRVTELERGACCVPHALSESGLLFPTLGRPRISIYGQQGSGDTEVQHGDGSQMFA